MIGIFSQRTGLSLTVRGSCLPLRDVPLLALSLFLRTRFGMIIERVRPSDVQAYDSVTQWGKDNGYRDNR